MDLQRDVTGSLRVPIALVITSHVTGIMVSIIGIVFLERIIPTGAEGGWLTRIYVGFLLAVAVLANLALVICAFLKKGISPIPVVFRLIISAAPVLLVLWHLFRGEN